ncbi:MAG: hypothetical protein C4548_02125 [Desulfobacteraceae bacterium]|nr:MAG: hypothetical protein C4548_02125 [Desulfobacteraceae bacterium]
MFAVIKDLLARNFNYILYNTDFAVIKIAYTYRRTLHTENSPFLEPSSVIIFKKTTKRRYTIVKKSDDQEQIRWAGIYGKMLYN